MTTPHDRSFLTIVSGLPRSGTSMMMRMLEAGGMPVLTDQVRRADDDNPNGYYEMERVKQTKEDPTWLVDSEGKVVKMVYRLLYDLPWDRAYRVLFMRRDLREILASQRAMLTRQGLPSDEEVSDDDLAALFRREIESFYAWAERLPHLQLIDVNYHVLVQDPPSELQQIQAFLGGDLDLEAMAAVVDPTLYRNREQRPSLART